MHSSVSSQSTTWQFDTSGLISGIKLLQNIILTKAKYVYIYTHIYEKVVVVRSISGSVL